MNLVTWGNFAAVGVTKLLITRTCLAGNMQEVWLILQDWVTGTGAWTITEVGGIDASPSIGAGSSASVG